MFKLTMRLPIFLALMELCLCGLAPGMAQIEPPVFLGPGDQPLPIQDEDEILSFLRIAPEISSELIEIGITGAWRLVLSKDGVEARAAFHRVQKLERKTKRLPNDKIVGYVRDSYTSQVAAYRLGRLLKVHNIPPTVLRRSDGRKGSAQLWIENGMMEKERLEKGIEPADRTLWNQLYSDMRVFDNLINNIDRNTGNMLVDSSGHLWLIDHTRSFGRDRSLPRPETIARCSNRLHQAILELDQAAVESQLEELLAKGEIKAIFHRRTALLKKLDERIRERGEHQVLFDYGDAEPGIRILDGELK